MEVGRQITFWFIACCCANIIYGKELAVTAPTMLSTEEFSRSELKTGNLSGKVTAHKNGTKVKLTLTGNVFWKNDKSIDNITCAVPAVKEKGEKGDRGFTGFPGLDGIKGAKGNRGDTGKDGAEGKKGDRGEAGEDGEEGKMGHKGDRGEAGKDGAEGKKGEKGDKGEKGECKKEEENFSEKDDNSYGKQKNPAYSCSTFSDATIYLNKPNSFKVHCNNYAACIKDLPKGHQLTDFIKTKPVWLSSKIQLKEFYTLSIPNLSYLMSIHNGFHLILTYSDEVEVLEILSWNGIKRKISESIANGCKLIRGGNGGQTVLELKCEPAFYLPMDFYIKAKTEEVSIELTSLCFT